MTEARGRVAVFPGSFDPLTNGHVDLVRRGTRLFDRVVVAILVNTGKTPWFSVEERVSLAREVFARDARVEVDEFQGLLVDYARRIGATTIVRGLRAVSDFEYELQMALMNRRMAAELDTIFLAPSEAHTYVSSRLVKEIATLGGDIGPFVPPEVADRLRSRAGAR